MKAHSLLTRRVFRALIANRPYVSRECLRRPLPSQVSHVPRGFQHQQRRYFLESLLGDNRPPRALSGEKPTAKNLDAAVTKLVDLLRARRSRSRTPAHAELIDALKFLFSARLEQRRPLTRNEIFLATETFKHLQERDWILSEHKGSISEDELASFLHTLALPESGVKFRSDVRALAELVVESLTRNGALDEDLENAYTTILASTGSAAEAVQRVSAKPSRPDLTIMANTLKGLIHEANNSLFWSQLGEWNEMYQIMNPYMHQELVVTLVRAGRIFDAQQVYDMSIVDRENPTTACVLAMLEATTKSGKLASAEELAASLYAHTSEPGVVGALLLYQVAKNPRLENLRDLVLDLLHSSRAEVSTKSFNDIAEYALLHNQPKLAEEILGFARVQQYRPDAKTYALELSRALDAARYDIARASFERLVNEDRPDDDYDVKVLNRYLEVYCFSQAPSFEHVMRIADRILERGADFDVGAISGLCLVFLSRNEFDDAVGLLRYRTDFLPPTDRARISVVFRDFILNSANNDQQAFNAYELFRVAFPETSSADRIPLMQSFFDRKRPDLACQVFIHMRQATAHDFARPDSNAYAKCFEGIAQCRDVDGLQQVYNMLKLDLNVEITTKIRNALMLAHISCQTPWVAIIDHFYKIMDSREGPSYSSFEVALRACETWPPYGSFEARKIMAIMQSWNLEITKSLYDNYVGVMAGQCEFENAVELIENMYKDIGERPDAFTIGTFYNAIPWQYRKNEVEKWAREAYPELWEELETFGEEIDEEWEVRYFKLDRSIDIDDSPLFGVGEWRFELQRQVQAQIEPLPMST